MSDAGRMSAPFAVAREQRKEFNYVLQLSPADAQILRKYHDLLSQGVAGFAQRYYDFLFDNPATADVLYAYERSGGNIGDLVRAQLQQMLKLLSVSHDDNIANIGQRHYIKGVKPLWVMGAFRLFLDHLQALVAASEDVSAKDRRCLESALVKRVFLDMGLMLQGHWEGMRRDLEVGRQQAQIAQARIEDLLINTAQYLWSYDVRAHTLLYVSPALRELCLPDGHDPIPCFERVHPDDREKVTAAWQLALDGEPAEVLARVSLHSEQERWCNLHFRSCRSGRRRVQRIDGYLMDTTESQNALASLKQQATTDALTGLANRTLWYDRVRQALARSRREEGRQLVLMLLDLDHFKLVNEEFGHAAGDELLKQVAQRLLTALRDSDTLARLGDDEFAILMPSEPSGERAGERVAAKLLSCFEHPFTCAGGELFLNASLGIAVYPEHGDDVDVLLGHADTAMYRAKRSDGHYSFYAGHRGGSTPSSLQFSSLLRHALDRNELELLYQPKVQLIDKQFCGFEALLRWQHPEEGMVQPAQFLPTAEQIGVMTPITYWVLATALRQCKIWRAAGALAPVSVNVSARSFYNPRLLERIRWALHEAEVGGECLELEITEDTLMGNFERGQTVLAQLRELGVTVVVEQFGRGYSSLSDLRRLPIDSLKIDQSFLKDLVSNAEAQGIVRSVIELGHNLGFRVLAGGVEDAQVWDLLAALGCDAGQGYHISRPLPEARLCDWLQRANALIS